MATKPGQQRLGIRALTMQQPFAAALANGICLYTRRGKPTTFPASGEVVGVHCGQNDEHLRNGALMREVRRVWPGCPTDEALRAGQRSILGVARFVDGACDARAAAKTDPVLALYACTKPVAWRADAARACAAPLPYPKGNLQLWHVAEGGFADPTDCARLLEVARLAGAPPALEAAPRGAKRAAERSEATGGGRKKQR